ncbi:MAG TPA: ATP-binding protein [Gemmatimonadaceae bacterium]|nr:ATP-binding protein [Gemmatimonadaceae bacterium]
MRRDAATSAPRAHAVLTWWTAMAAATLLAAAAWLREPTVPYLLATGVATAGLAVLTLRAGPIGRPWRLGVLAAAAVFCATAIAPQRTLWRTHHDWAAYEGAALEASAGWLDARLGRAAAEARRLATAALDVPGGPAGFERLALLVRADEERAVVLLERGKRVAWAGMLRTSVAAVPEGLGAVRTPFYDVLTVRLTRGARRAVATVLLDAHPPASVIARSLADVVTAQTAAGAVHFAIVDEGPPAADAALRLRDGRWLVAWIAPLVREEVALRVTERARAVGLVALVLLAIMLLGSVWGPAVALRYRLTILAALLAAGARVPLNTLSNVSAVFDPSYYFVAEGGPFTGSVGALAITGVLALLALLAILRARVRLRSRVLAVALVLLAASLGPYLLRDLAHGIVTPPRGAPTSLWLAWQLALFLAATVVLLLGASAGRAAIGRWHGLSPLVAPAVAAVAALLAPPLLDASVHWPTWYPLLWVVAIVALALTRRSSAVVLAAAAVASLGAMTLLWGTSVRARVELADADVAGLTRIDPIVATLLDRFTLELQRAPLPTTRAELVAAYAASDLAAADHSVQLTTWRADGTRAAEVTDVAGGEMLAELRDLADSARRSGQVVQTPIASGRGIRLAAAVPDDSGRVTTLAIAQRTRLLQEDPYAPLLVGAPAAPAGVPYSLSLVDATRVPLVAPGAEPRWVRHDDALHGDWSTMLEGRHVAVHVEVELRSLWSLVQRGTLLLLLDLLVVTGLWLLNALAGPGLPRWLRARRRRWARSYRARLSLALFGFFVVPAIAFGIWSSRQLQTGYREARELLVFEALRDAAGASLPGRPPDELPVGRAEPDAPLLLYEDGALVAASDDLFASLAPFGRLLPPDVALSTAGSGHAVTSRLLEVGAAQVLVGYRALPSTGGAPEVLAVPARADELALDARRRDLGILVLFATVIGALAALVLSGVAARELARPIGALRQAALGIAGGQAEPPLPPAAAPAEFVPVFSAFRQMAGDLSASRRALEEAERRTAAVLRHTASAVIAVDAGGHVMLFNPAAQRLFGAALRSGVPLHALGVPALEALIAHRGAGPAGGVQASRDDAGERGAETLELTLGARQMHVRLAPLAERGGAVLTLDDVTELARAQRVLAWGEMARQVAHEIKNPLTPIRLGVQHLRRAYLADRGDFAAVLAQNVDRILAEIDRLDQIARAFSRYGTAPGARPAGEPIDVAAVLHDVVALERLGATDGGSVSWQLEGAEAPCRAVAQRDELREVLLNLLENARLAQATTVRVALRADAPPGPVRITVTDDGAGIPPDVLPRIFEPHFSTRTSGSGLGLAISRRLVEGWGGTIDVRSEPGRGTRVELALAAVGV